MFSYDIDSKGMMVKMDLSVISMLIVYVILNWCMKLECVNMRDVNLMVVVNDVRM